MTLAIAQRTSRLFIVIGAVLVLSIHFGSWTEAVERNRDAVEISHALLSGDADRLKDADNDLSGVLAQNPEDARATIWWAHVQMTRGELSALIPLLESGRIADSERGRLMLIRLGEMFLHDLDPVHFRMAWQQAEVWGDPPLGQYLQILEMARGAMRKKQWAEALELFRILEAWHPSDAAVHRYLASILFDGYNDLAGAIAEREQVLALDPDSFWDLMSLGGLYLQAGRLHEAQQQFERATKVDPNHERPVAALAGVFWEQGRLDEAARVMETFLEKHPDNSFVLVRLAGVYRDQGREAEAVSLLETFLERNPDNVPALVILGVYYKGEGHMDEVVRLVEHAIQQDGDPYYLALGHDILASIASSRGDTDAAAWHAEQARAIRTAYEEK